MICSLVCCLFILKYSLINYFLLDAFKNRSLTKMHVQRKHASKLSESYTEIKYYCLFWVKDFSVMQKL